MKIRALGKPKEARGKLGRHDNRGPAFAPEVLPGSLATVYGAPSSNCRKNIVHAFPLRMHALLTMGDPRPSGCGGLKTRRERGRLKRGRKGSALF